MKLFTNGYDREAAKGFWPVPLIVLFIAILFFTFSPKRSNTTHYNYEYVLPDSINTGSLLRVQSIDTIPPGYESGAIIRIILSK